ncbi:hypothetical protein FHX42_002085 [Saccharopolyspora lacisalsi]|uniref:Uncharacterized protein n=1 Tax=Halosaccharopolyspora lacisalsi TaxID=1000566 RepID=A0A839E195_9PSEU|nr:hypothetical protein [Halosaccharopolyspora lacisalsi]
MSMGQIHRYGDRRMPIPGVLGGVAAALAAVTAGLAGRIDGAVANGVAVVCGGAWMVLYVRVSAPINRQLTSAARAGAPSETLAACRRGAGTSPGDLVDVGHGRVSGVEPHPVETTAVRDFLREGLGSTRIGVVGHDPALRQLLPGRSESVRMGAGHDRVTVLGGDALRTGQTDTAGASGDQHSLTRESRHHCSCPSWIASATISDGRS